MHDLLETQLRECFGKNAGIPEQLLPFIKMVGETYARFEENNSAQVQEEIQKRKTAEDDHAREQVHLQASQHIAHIGSWEMELSNPNIFANKMHWSDELSRILEYRQGKVEMSIKAFLNRVHPDDLHLVVATLTRAIETRNVYELEHNLLLPGKKIKPVYGRAEIIYDGLTGSPLKVIGTLQDISERIKARVKLQKAHNELKTLFNNMQEVFFSIDMEKYEVLQMSKTCETLYGYTAKDFAADVALFSRVILEEDRHIAERHKVDRATGKTFTYEYRIRHKNGSVRWVETKVTPTSDKAGNLVRLDGITSDITKRKEAEIELAKAHSELKTLLRNMHEVFYSINMEDNYQLLQISQTCEKVYGYPAADFFANPNLWLDVVLEEDKHIIYSNYEVMNAGLPFTQEYRIRHKDGSIRWLESRITPTLNSGKKLVRLDGTTVDITKRKEAELALRDNEIRFRYLIDNCADGILIRKEDKEIVYCSDSVYGVIGYRPAEVIGKKTLNDIHPRDMHIILNHWDEVLKKPGRPITIVYRRMHKNGQWIWCEGTSTNMLHQPEVKGVVVNFRDITERKEVELALKDSEYKFRSLIQHSADAIMILDENHKVMYASDSLYRITGYTPEEVMQKKPFQFIHPDDMEDVLAHAASVLADPGGTQQATYRRLKKDGSAIWCECSVTNMLNEPAVQGIVINFRDITGRKQSEDALRASNEELHKINNELDRFVYSVSHDLRAPLTSMSGLVSLAATETADERIHQYLSMLQTSITKLDGFIHDILDYSRNSRTGIRKSEINFKKMLDEIASEMQFMNKEKNISIHADVETAEPYYSDKGRISMILNNLISNAVRYYDPQAADPYVHINVRHEAGNIRIDVTDNGIGIGSDHHDKIFQMFYRISHRSTGSGLGLYIVKETIEKLNGKIEFHSEPGKGTTFTALVPDLGA